MVGQLEILPNEIFINIFSYLSWDEILISLWSLNKRINLIICLIFSINKNGISFNQPNLSYEKVSKILLPLIFKSLLFCSSIKYIHLNGNYSNSYDLIHQYFYGKDKENFCFLNLKSLHITQCLLSKSLIEKLSLLIQYQLNELKLTFDEDIFGYHDRNTSFISNNVNLMIIFEKFLCKIFSHQCQLTSLQLDISASYYDIHQCLKSHSLNLSSNKFDGLNQSNCLTLRYLHIRIKSTYFLEHVIEHVLNLEQLTVCFRNSLIHSDQFYSNIQKLTTSNESWFSKVPKLKCFILKTRISNDSEFIYLKWLLNNVNYIQKLQISLSGEQAWRDDQIIWKSIIDANFIRQYCLPDKIIHLIDFDFYIRSKRQLSLIDIEKIKNSFKTDSFFIEHQWTNVKCFYDENKSYQHLFSFTQRKAQSSYLLKKYPCIDYWSNIRCIQLNFHPSLYLFLEQFNGLCPNVASLIIRTGSYLNQSKIIEPLTIPFEIGQRNLNDIRLENVTKLHFGDTFSGSYESWSKLTYQDQLRAKVFAHLISMLVQLKYLFVERFEWLLHVIEYGSDNLRKNALSTVRHAEFSIPSCNHGSSRSTIIGKRLVPFLRTYMPHLQTLRVRRSDDFPWTTIRPYFKSGYFYDSAILRWMETLRTAQSMYEHRNIFEQDLSRLFEQLKQLIFLDIHGKISPEKLEIYRLMIQSRFPNSQFDIQTSRFRLWI